MALVDAAQFEVSFGTEAPLNFSVTAEELRKKVSDSGLRLDDVGRKLIEDLLTVAASAEQQIAEQNERIRILQGLSITDELTGLLNRRGFHDELERALARTERNDERGVLLLCDLNRFKGVNDTYGHLAGDAVLCEVADLLRRLTRRSDYVARLGGDEFAVLMTNTCPDSARKRAHGLALKVNSLRIMWQNSMIPVSAAFGTEVYDRTSRSEHLFALADQALYRDKEPTMLEVV